MYIAMTGQLLNTIYIQGQLFDGLEEDESNLDAETFVPRRNFKKLVIRNSSGTGGGFGVGGGGGSTRGSNSPHSTSFDNDLQNNARGSLGNRFGLLCSFCKRSAETVYHIIVS